MSTRRTPITSNPGTKVVDFETETGIFGFRYESLQYYRWETHSQELGPQAVHLFFAAATVSVVGHELKGLLPAFRKQLVSEVRLGTKGKLSITYIAVYPHDTTKKHEGVDRGIAK